MAGIIENLLAQANTQNPETSSVTGASRVFQTEAEAEKSFQKVRRKLFDIKCWNVESEITSFSLFDLEGAAQPDRQAVVGDFIKTVLPASGKADWVQITEIFESPDEVVLTVKPSRNPTDKTHKSTTSHFFVAESSNNFCLQKVGAKIIFHVIGLNEQTNVNETDGFVETVRNAAVANIGCFFGIQETQWKTFSENLIETEKAEEH